jgi:predicted ATPase
MLRSITLQNFKSFGVRQTVPLEPITVLVGPNNSGKSNLLSVGPFVAECVVKGLHEVFSAAGGPQNIIHRPPMGLETLLSWETDEGSYAETFSYSSDRVVRHKEVMRSADGNINLTDEQKDAFYALRKHQGDSELHQKTGGIWLPLLRSRFIHLSLDVLRQDSQFVSEPRLAGNGAELASVLALWRSAYPDKANQLDDFLRKCLPELKFVLVQPSPEAGRQRLWVEQTNGQRFDSRSISEGVLCFIALAMHIIDAGPGALLLIEEPERSIHPRRLHDLVELMRHAVHERQCQFILSTHSRVLLDDFRDEPEAIVLFRRSDTPDQSTLVKRLADIPDLAENLSRSPPGEMLETGFFSRPFET